MGASQTGVPGVSLYSSMRLVVTDSNPAKKDEMDRGGRGVAPNAPHRNRSKSAFNSS